MIGDDAIMCTGKKQFPTYWAAQRAAKNLNKHNQKVRGNPYKCPFARHFHVGSTMGHMKKRQPSRHSLKEIARRGQRI